MPIDFAKIIRTGRNAMGFVTCIKRDTDNYYRLGPSPKDSHYLTIKEGRFFKENDVWYLYFVTPRVINAKYKPDDKWIDFDVPTESLCRIAFEPSKVAPYKDLSFEQDKIYTGVWRFDPNILEYEKDNFLTNCFSGLQIADIQPSEILKNVTHTVSKGGGKKYGDSYGGGTPKQTEYDVLQDRKRWVIEQYRSLISLNNEKILPEVRDAILKSEDLLEIATYFDCDYWGYPSNDSIDSHPSDLPTAKRLFDEMMALILGRHLVYSKATSPESVNKGVVQTPQPNQVPKPPSPIDF